MPGFLLITWGFANCVYLSTSLALANFIPSRGRTNEIILNAVPVPWWHFDTFLTAGRHTNNIMLYIVQVGALGLITYCSLIENWTTHLMWNRHSKLSVCYILVLWNSFCRCLIFRIDTSMSLRKQVSVKQLIDSNMNESTPRGLIEGFIAQGYFSSNKQYYSSASNRSYSSKMLYDCYTPQHSCVLG